MWKREDRKRISEDRGQNRWKSVVFILCVLFGSCGAELAGDYNGDGIVNLSDYAMAASGDRFNQRVLAVVDNWLAEDHAMGKYAQFATDGYIQVATSTAFDLGTADFTICFTIKMTDIATPQCVISRDDLASAGFSVAISSNTLLINLFSSLSDFVTASAPVTSAMIGEWVFVAIVKTSAGVQVYFNNVAAVMTQQMTGSANLSFTGGLFIGCYDYSSFKGDYLNASLDDIRIYTSALTEAQRAMVVNNMRGMAQAGSPVPAWRMNFDVADGTAIQGIKANGFELNGTKSGTVTLVDGGVPFTIVAATGSTGIAVSALKDLLAESATFQTDLALAGTDAEKIAAAKNSIHLTQYDAAAGEFTRPFILLSRIASEKGASVASGTVDSYNMSGAIEMRIERAIPAAYRTDSGLAETDFMNVVDGILDDMMTLAGQPGYLVISGWEIIDGPFQFSQDRSEASDYVYGIRVRVNWGLS